MENINENFKYIEKKIEELQEEKEIVKRDKEIVE